MGATYSDGITPESFITASTPQNCRDQVRWLRYSIPNLLPYFEHVIKVISVSVTFRTAFLSVGEWLSLVFAMQNDDCQEPEALISLLYSSYHPHIFLAFSPAPAPRDLKISETCFCFLICQLLTTHLIASTTPSRNRTGVQFHLDYQITTQN